MTLWPARAPSLLMATVEQPTFSLLRTFTSANGSQFASAQVWTAATGVGVWLGSGRRISVGGAGGAFDRPTHRAVADLSVATVPSTLMLMPLQWGSRWHSATARPHPA